jgi:macrolide transport system ATP-binding/permease protein
MPRIVPAFARWLLRLVSQPEQRDWVVADLEEEAGARADAAGTAKARRWACRQAVLSLVPLASRRVQVLARGIRRTPMIMWRGLGSDIRLAFRRLVKEPGFSLVCVLTLALGIGGNTAVFTLINRVILEPLPVARPSELYRLGDTDSCCVNSGLLGSFSLFSYDLYLHLKNAAPQFTELAAFQATPRVFTIGASDGDAPAATVLGSFVSGNYFQTFGLLPAAGRLLAERDDRAGASPVAVISHRAWTDRYQSSPTVVGKTIALNGVPTSIVGVAPPGFYGEMLRPNPAEVWIPLAHEPLLQPQARLLEAKPSHWLYAIGRLKPGTPTLPIQARLTTTLQQWIEATLDLSSDDRAHIRDQHITVIPAAGGIGSMRDEVAPSLKLLQALAAVVLLIACANLANLLLARGMSRRPETAVRAALGAPRSRLVAQSLMESVVLSSIGGLAGLAVAYPGARAIVEMTFRGASSVPIDPSPSLPVLAFAFAVSLVTGATFGAAPAMLESRSDPMDALRGAGRSTGDRGSRVRRSLIVLQLALSLVLLTCAGLVARSLNRLQDQDFGFEIEGRYVVELSHSLGATSAAELQSIYGLLRERLAGIPGVTNSALSLYSPMSGDNWASTITVEGRPASERLVASWVRVSPEYFTTIGTPLLRGRVIDDRDRPDSPLVAIVNQTFARRFFGDSDPIGRRFGFADPSGAGQRNFEIVGIVGDAKYQDARLRAYATFFLPFLQQPSGGTDEQSGLDRSHYPRAVEIHVTSAAQDLEGAVRRAIASVDRRITVRSLMPLDEQVAGNFNMERVIARLTGAFGLVALLLACLGLYGVTAYAVTRRVREIGVRMAIGASRSQVLHSILRGALLHVAIGLAIGLPAALAAGRLLEARLFGVSGHDPAILLGGLAMLTLCALVAAFVPARRAANLDPIRALRVE